MMCNIVPQTTMVEESQGWLIHIEVVARILVAIPSWEAPRRSLSLSLQLICSQGIHGSLFRCVDIPLQRWCLPNAILRMCGYCWTRRWNMPCGIGSDTPIGMGGTLDLHKCTIVGAIAPEETVKRAPGVPPPPEYLPETKDAQIVKNTIKGAFA